MIVRIQKRENPFALVDKRPLCDARLSWKARGLLAYLLSKPDDWQVILADLVNHGTDGVDSVRAGLQELKRLGYARLEVVRDSSGRVEGKRWIIFELPVPDDYTSPTSEKADVGKTPTSGNSDPTNNDCTTKKDCPNGAKAPELFQLEDDCPEIPSDLRTPELLEQWRGWKADKRARRKKLSDTAIKLQVRKMVGWGVERSIAALLHSREMDYQGLFEAKAQDKKASTLTPRRPITRETALSLPPRVSK